MLHSHTFSKFNGASGTARGGTAPTHHPPVITQLENTHAAVVCALWPSLENTTASFHEYSTPLASAAWKCKVRGLPRCASTAHSLYFTALLFSTTQTLCITHRQAFPHPNHSIVNAKCRNAGEESPPSSQQGP